MDSEVYLLTFNREPLFASRNITVLWHAITNRCHTDKLEMPLPYATVRRRIMAEGKYIHEPRPGWRYEIIIRTLVKKSIQTRMRLEQDTEPKQSQPQG